MEMSGKARWKHHNLPLLLLTDEIDGRKKQMIALAVSSGFTFSSHLSKCCQTLKAFFSHLLMLLARGWVEVQDWTDSQHWQHWTDSQQAISDETWLCNGKNLLLVDSIWIRRLPMTRESKPSLFRWNEVVGNHVKAKPEGSFSFQNELGGPERLAHSLTYFLDKGNNNNGLTILVQMLLRSRLHVSAFLCPCDCSKYYGLQCVVYFVPT